MTPLDRADLRRWKHALDYHRDKYGKDKAFRYAFEEYWRSFIGIELNPDYVKLAESRLLETPIAMI